MNRNTISVNPGVLGGKPVIKGTRIPVYVILELMEAGKSIQDIVDDYPELKKQDVKNALHYAHALLKREELVLNP
jgi:uncharacterized protein (DUF433 family)